MLELAVSEAATWLANMVLEYKMSMVKDGFSDTQLTTKSLLALGLNITPEDYGHENSRRKD